MLQVETTFIPKSSFNLRNDETLYDNTLRLIVEGTAGATGEEFFRSLVRHLALALGVRYAWVAEFTAIRTRVRTLAFCAGQECIDNFEYDLDNVPCAKVYETGSLCLYREGLQKLFPRDKDLVTIGAESYVGVPLVDSSGNVLGHLAIIDTKAFPDKPRDMPIFKIFAARARAELERLRTDRSLKMALQNLTDTKNRLIQTEKMASLGQMVAGIAHEINNPLGVLTGAATFLKQHIEDRDRMIAEMESLGDMENVKSINARYQYDFIQQDTEEVLSLFENGVGRIKKIVDSLLVFSRFDHSDLRLVNINEEIDHTVDCMKHETKDGIEIVRQFGPLPEIECSPGLLHQVFLNILRNAIQAILQNGKIFIRTYVDRDLICTSIRDTGVGIRREILNKVFDPFFTTKDVGQGTGLGLSISYAIVEYHGGEILVESAQGAGTEFIVKLPLVQISAVNKISDSIEVE